jgi:hypothetical protein
VSEYKGVTLGGSDQVTVHEVDVEGISVCSWLIEETSRTFTPRRWRDVAQDWVGFPRNEGIVYFSTMDQALAFIAAYEFGEGA